MHPVTTSCRQLPVFLCSAISRMASIDSCFALSMKAQVLTTSTSAAAGSRVSSCPDCWASPSITSESTRFLGQPREIMPIFIGDDLRIIEKRHVHCRYRLGAEREGPDGQADHRSWVGPHPPRLEGGTVVHPSSRRVGLRPAPGRGAGGARELRDRGEEA